MPTRLVLDKTEMEHIDEIVSNLLEQCKANCAIVVEQDGRCVLKKGFTRTSNIEALAALLAGSFSSTKAIADLVGEKDFTVLIHQGEKDNIHTHLIDQNRILSIFFDNRTSIETVRRYSLQAAEQLTDIFTTAAARATDARGDFKADLETSKKLETIFKQSDEIQ